MRTGRMDGQGRSFIIYASTEQLPVAIAGVVTGLTRKEQGLREGTDKLGLEAGGDVFLLRKEHSGSRFDCYSGAFKLMRLLYNSIFR